MAESFFKAEVLPLQAKASLYVVLGCILIAVGPFFVEFSGADAMTSSFYRMLIGGVAFLYIAFLRNGKLPGLRFLWLYLLAGLMITLDMVSCNQSILYIGSGLSTVLSNLEIVFLLLIGFIFFKERLPKLYLPMCILILIGITFLLLPYFSEIHPQKILGIVFALAASFIYSFYLTLLKMIGKNNPESTPATTLGVVCILGTVILGSFMAWHPAATFYLPNNWQSISSIVAYSLISQVVGWWFITKGLDHVSLSISGVLFLTQPALTFLGDCLFLGRNTDWMQLTGGAVLLIAVYLTVRNENKNLEKE